MGEGVTGLISRKVHDIPLCSYGNSPRLRPNAGAGTRGKANPLHLLAARSRLRPALDIGGNSIANEGRLNASLLIGGEAMRRRSFIYMIVGLTITPAAAIAQQVERVRRIAILMNRAANDPEGQARLTTFKQALEQLGWSEGRNMQIDIRWGEDDIDLERKLAAELVALGPDLIVAAGTVSMTALQPLSRTLPIVFAVVADPVGAGFVKSLASPGGNATGFSLYEYGLSGKWVELLKQVAPSVTRVALRDVTNPAGLAYFGAIRATAQSFGLEMSPVAMQSADEIEKGIKDFARSPNGGMIVTPNSSASVHRALIIGLAAQYKLPAIYPFSYMAAAGGLMSYGPDFVDQFRNAAGYVDRVLKGEKPADLPVQQPTRYKLVLNLKTAKALGLSVSNTLVGLADEVIE
jgi:putative ABC transport system substrate-binding protein